MVAHDAASQQPDDALMVRYANGELSAFQELYRRYEKRVYGFCLRYLSDRDSAADAFQDVFVRVIDTRRKFEPQGRFAQWIFTIARRVCIDRLRGSREGVADGAESPPESPAPVNPIDSLARRDQAQRLLAGIPAEQRDVLLLSRYYGFKYAEIAEMIGSSEAAVKQKVYRALQSIRGAQQTGTASLDDG